MSGSNLAFIVTGSIAAYKACDAISRLIQRGHRVRVVATEAARRFVGEATLEGLTGQTVLTDLWARGAALEHIELTRWADVLVVCPATANTLNRFAAGLADDLAGAVFLAHDRAKPCLIVPAMNPAMWRHPATVASVARLREWGMNFAQVGEGRTACGEVGEGRLAEPAEIVSAIEALLVRPKRPLRVLVTSGGTSEPIDGVRVLTNRSTGRTGAGIAAHFSRHGHEVFLLRARASAGAEARCREETFFSFADLDAALSRKLGEENFDVVIHAAAVGDFSLDEVTVDGMAQSVGQSKLDSDSAPILRLKRNPKLVDALRARSRNRAIAVVAFKLTQGATPEAAAAAVMALFEHSAADFVVHNDLADCGESGAFPADIHQAGGGIAAHCNTRAEIAPALERLLGVETSTDEIFSTPHHHVALS
ncbi:MAG: coaBC [Verrucomicrobia bacterium]|nr:coaBC [Verrucomicrobiota bacterium]